MAVNAVGQAADANGTVVFHREKIKFHYAQKTGIHSLFDQDNFLIKRDFLSYLDLVREGCRRTNETERLGRLV
jgi:hypothetical protein